MKLSLLSILSLLTSCYVLLHKQAHTQRFGASFPGHISNVMGLGGPSDRDRNRRSGKSIK